MSFSYYEKVGLEVRHIDEEIPFGLAENWIWCRGYTFLSGMDSKRPQKEYFYYIDIDSIDNHRHCISTPKHLSTSKAPSRANRALHEGSVLFSLVRPYLENIAFVTSEYKDCIASTGFYICNSNGILVPEYMYYLMLSSYVVLGLNQYMKGDNSPSISKSNIEDWLYPVPPIEEQTRIVEKTQNLLQVAVDIGKDLN